MSALSTTTIGRNRKRGGNSTYGVVSRLLLRAINNRTRHTRHHDDTPLDVSLDHMLPGLPRKQKSAHHIDIHHFLPVVEIIGFRGFTTCDACIRTHDIYFAEIFDNLSKSGADC